MTLYMATNMALYRRVWSHDESTNVSSLRVCGVLRAVHYVLYTALDGENGSASTSFEEARLIDKSRSRGKPFHVTLGQV